ncbi:hypothetical protein CO051_04985 [Candidatus Roizmanbacteria bacterium CG_4_9_14_0_2_um_filter_39_13]|uniref:50S ribosomal protein L22 n=2 Tax=Candidatus Roizmaniibacteriota TaxID=1752723 RepID=A0A2M8EXG5_9BACT|nr:MAG: hypothetical protein COY15_04000 [Candidatus Roizmanbacteria bacterium CG_4_10_14_0_2_um_filter_39_12]PJC30750.1 MAG: hypothetical protein CO051_04985 [Candidatus Roizmanbacteria bacterium CG_4_9_14_0_2_um_filter_39_13]PJE62269.1 MAG: hypothetical protein COU87_00085 [Candidatus Roizmanbacteria bacterium CG10_big_fil_rev_8_21_14_0_10_39_12]
MESLTYIKNVKSTPKKLRMIRDLIVQMEPHDALDYLMYATSKASNIYYKAVQSAIANATLASKVSPDMLKFKLLTIEEGRTLKRHHAGSKGMAKPILKNFAHIKIILESEQKVIPAQVEKVSKKKTKGKKIERAKNIETKQEVASQKKSIAKGKSVTKKVQK